jgi:hypothetical protein
VTLVGSSAILSEEYRLLLQQDDAFGAQQDAASSSLARAS